MRRFRSGLFFAALPLLAMQMQYPDAPRGNTVDDYHGVNIADPYRWLENPDSPDSRRWIEQENALTSTYLGTVSNVPAIKQELSNLWSPRNYTPAALVRKGRRYFFARRDSGQNQPVLYWTDSRPGEPKVLLDPNTLSSEGTAALLSWSVSNDGERLAYGIARAGSDWQDVRVRDVSSGRDLADKLEWIKFSQPEWSADGKSFYYGRFPTPESGDLLRSANFNQKLYLHVVGTSQVEDKLVYERPDHKDWMFAPQVTEDGRYLVIQVAEGTRPENLVFYRDLHESAGKTIELIDKFDAVYDFLGNRSTKFYFRSTANAPKGRVGYIDIARGPSLHEVVAEAGNALNQAVVNGASMYLVYEKDVVSEVKACDLDGRCEKQVPLPGKGEATWAMQCTPGEEQFFVFSSFTEPLTLYSYDSRKGSVEPYEKSSLPFNPEQYETKQIFYPSKDGTKIPMFLVGRKGFQPDPKTPCLLWGYGGFNISNAPHYSPLFLEFINLGGIVASANLRGGGEYGEAWHEAGMKLKKQNVFDDFIAAAEWLISNQYTTKEKLGIYGRSNGGLLIGAVLNQRPDLFGAAVPGVGVMDMLRFTQFTIGSAWTSDYGSPDRPEEFRAIRAYSPLHNIQMGGRYPPVLVLTSDHDDRVVPAHSFKYAATLQHAQAAESPVLIRIETSAGHGGGKPVTKQVDEAAAILAFLEKSLGMNI